MRRIEPYLHLKATLRLFLACRHCNIYILLLPLAPKISRNSILQMCAAVYTWKIFMQYNEKADENTIRIVEAFEAVMRKIRPYKPN